MASRSPKFSDHLDPPPGRQQQSALMKDLKGLPPKAPKALTQATSAQALREAGLDLAAHPAPHARRARAAGKGQEP